MKFETIIKNLKENAAPIIKAKSFKPSPGVYAFFFKGTKFPISNYSPSKTEIIYLGKTQSSGISRVLNTHFGTGKTGSSTVRRTLGALLREELNLIPIPRNNSDKIKNRLSFKFDDSSEQKLTEWMEKHLLISFHPLEISDVPKIEKDLINQLKPVLNIEGNSYGQFYIYLKSIRKDCSYIALNNISKVKKIETEKIPTFLYSINENESSEFFGCIVTAFKWFLILSVLLAILITLIDN
ncbi:GIY-YIG nuclease family protein [Marivirga sp.]|uniref:GIY-YIG nuclease family protein n=1 Tax=Marivirga sp. TaxID=2018662 RepID=UPI003DA74B9E